MYDYPQLFVAQLGEHDFRVLAGLSDAPESVDELRDRLRQNPSSVESHISDSRLYTMLFESARTPDIQLLTPSLAFAALVHETMRSLQSSTYVSEWVGAGERLPVFDVASLRSFIADSPRRFMIIELLNSFTRIASGSMWVRTSRGYRRRRYSELDPVSVAEMVETLPEPRRPAGYRRLGDVTLFLTGVFPDHTARHPSSQRARERLARLIGVGEDHSGEVGYVHFLEAVGRGSYDRASRGPLVPVAGQRHLRDVAANFTEARRFLNYLADRYLHRFETGLMNPVG